MTGTRPSVLFVSPLVPDITGNGLAMRAGVTFDGLTAGCAVDLMVVPVAGPGPIPDSIRRRARRARVLPPSHRDRLFGVLSAIPDEAERQRALGLFPRPALARWSVATAAEHVAGRFGRPDVIYVLRAALAPFAEPWLGSPRRPVIVLDLDEDEVLKNRSVADLHERRDAPGPAALARREADKYAAMQARWFGLVDLVVGASERELIAAGSAGANTAVVANPVAPRRPGSPVDAVDLVFVGSLSYLPNADGAEWFCRRVMPLIRERIGRVRVAIVGSGPGEATLGLANRDVVVVGDVDSVSPWYEAATVAIAPLRAGGGSRLKILEAMDHDRPVVTTSVGCEGLPVVDGRDVLIADDPESFAAACVRLLASDQLRRRLVDAARPLVETHQWDVVARTIHDLVLRTHSSGPVR